MSFVVRGQLSVAEESMSMGADKNDAGTRRHGETEIWRHCGFLLRSPTLWVGSQFLLRSPTLWAGYQFRIADLKRLRAWCLVHSA
jgi:hypothetical protein